MAETVEFKILRAVRRVHSKLTTLAFRSAGVCWVEYHRIKPWREEEPKKAG